MRILTRYILREFLIPLVYCLTGFISIYVLFDLFGSFSKMAEHGISLCDVALYFCGYLAPYFHYIAPAALMLATLYTMWSFCRHSEIVAMRASGVSFLTIVKPLMAVAVLMACLVVWINESFVPGYSQWASQLKNAGFSRTALAKTANIVFRNARDRRTWNVNALLDDSGGHLGDVRVMIDRPDGGARLMTISAERADYLDGEWWFSGTRVQHYDALGQEIATPTPELDAVSFRCFGSFREKPSDFILQNMPWKYNSVRGRLRYVRTHPEMTDESRRDYVYDIWAQVMAPWACLIITLFAIPAGIASGRQSVFRGILGALGLYFAFYGSTILMMILAKNGCCPPVLASILPPVAFLVLGIRAFIRQR